MGNNDNIKELTDLQQDPIKGSLEVMRRHFQEYIEYNVLLAQLRRKAYEAYLAEGFSESESLILCQNMNMLG
jgi:hypothetical protein